MKVTYFLPFLSRFMIFWRAMWPSLGFAFLIVSRNCLCQSQHSSGLLSQKYLVRIYLGSFQVLSAGFQQPPASLKVLIPLAADTPAPVMITIFLAFLKASTAYLSVSGFVKLQYTSPYCFLQTTLRVSEEASFQAIFSMVLEQLSQNQSSLLRVSLRACCDSVIFFIVSSSLASVSCVLRLVSSMSLKAWAILLSCSSLEADSIFFNILLYFDKSMMLSKLFGLLVCSPLRVRIMKRAFSKKFQAIPQVVKKKQTTFNPGNNFQPNLIEQILTKLQQHVQQPISNCNLCSLSLQNTQADADSRILSYLSHLQAHTNQLIHYQVQNPNGKFSGSFLYLDIQLIFDLKVPANILVVHLADFTPFQFTRLQTYQYLTPATPARNKLPFIRQLTLLELQTVLRQRMSMNGGRVLVKDGRTQIKLLSWLQIGGKLIFKDLGGVNGLCDIESVKLPKFMGDHFDLPKELEFLKTNLHQLQACYDQDVKLIPSKRLKSNWCNLQQVQLKEDNFLYCRCPWQ